MKKFFRAFPPIYVVPGKSGANNNFLRIWIGGNSSYPAAVLAQEMHEQRIAWKRHFAPGFGLVIAAALALAIWQNELAFFGLLLLGIAFLAAYRLPALWRSMGVQGQVTEAVAAEWLYGLPLSQGLHLAAVQLVGSKTGADVGHKTSYDGKYNTANWSYDRMEDYLHDFVDPARDYVRRHQKEIAAGFTWFHGGNPPPYR